MRKFLLFAAVAAAALSSTACGDDNSTAPSASSTAKSTATSTAKSTATSPSAAATGDVILIDPDGNEWDRARAVLEAKEMAQAIKDSGATVDADFCEQGYTEGVKEGGQFPAGKQAWLDACGEGVRQAG